MLEIKCVILFSVLLSSVGCLLSSESELRTFVSLLLKLTSAAGAWTLVLDQPFPRR